MAEDILLDNDAPSDSPKRKPERPYISERIEVRYEAPLPPPGMMEHYERILPGSADRIIKILEQQSTHRQGLERDKIDSDIHNEKVGQIFAFILALIGLIGGLLLAWQGKSFSGLTAFLATLTGLIIVFIYGRRRQEKERAGKMDKLLDAMTHRQDKLQPPQLPPAP